LDVEELRWQLTTIFQGGVIYSYCFKENAEPPGPSLTNYDVLVWTPQPVSWEKFLLSGKASLGDSEDDERLEHECEIVVILPRCEENIRMWILLQLHCIDAAMSEDDIHFGDRRFFEDWEETAKKRNTYALENRRKYARFCRKGVVGGFHRRRRSHVHPWQASFLLLIVFSLFFFCRLTVSCPNGRR
jgi:hypothetical protein